VSETLLDVSVLVALFWRNHQFHQVVQSWFGKNARAGWATCALTEAAFVRIVSNPAFSASAVSPNEAVELLEANIAHPYHRFWQDEEGFVAAVRRVRGPLLGHRQVTDAYLLGLVLGRKARLTTLDRGIPRLLPEGVRTNTVEVLHGL
jgi:toxin-antitoxin system PIN domain toxin